MKEYKTDEDLVDALITANEEGFSPEPEPTEVLLKHQAFLAARSALLTRLAQLRKVETAARSALDAEDVICCACYGDGKRVGATMCATLPTSTYGYCNSHFSVEHAADDREIQGLIWTPIGVAFPALEALRAALTKAES